MSPVKASLGVNQHMSLEIKNRSSYLLIVTAFLIRPAGAANIKWEEAATQPRVTNRTAKRNNKQLARVLAIEEHQVIRDKGKQLVANEHVLQWIPGKIRGLTAGTSFISPSPISTNVLHA